jgi:hypothetical protein
MVPSLHLLINELMIRIEFTKISVHLEYIVKYLSQDGMPHSISDVIKPKALTAK